MPEAAQRSRSIDAVRGLAAMAVLLFHVFHELAATSAHPGLVTILFTDILDLGKAGVFLFFAVSGFLVPASLDPSKPEPVRAFLISRLFRLYPVYWLSIAAACVVFAATGAPAPDFATVAINLTMMQQFVGVPNVMGSYWTLQIELIFYGLCVLVFVAGRLQSLRFVERAATAAMMLAVGMAATRWATHWKLPVAIPFALAFMLFGCVWRQHIWTAQPGAKAAALRLLMRLALTIPLVSVLAYDFDAGGGETWHRYAITYATALLGFVVLTSTGQLRLRAAAYVGRISYPIYLLAPLVQLSLSTAFPDFRTEALLPLSVAFTTTALAALIHRLLEQPMVRTGSLLRAGNRKPRHRGSGGAGGVLL